MGWHLGNLDEVKIFSQDFEVVVTSGISYGNFKIIFIGVLVMSFFGPWVLELEFKHPHLESYGL